MYVHIRINGTECLPTDRTARTWSDAHKIMLLITMHTMAALKSHHYKRRLLTSVNTSGRSLRERGVGCFVVSSTKVVLIARDDPKYSLFGTEQNVYHDVYPYDVYRP